MSHFTGRILVFIAAATSMASFAPVHGAVWNGTADAVTGTGTDWNTAGNWSPASIPGAGEAADLRMTGADHTVNYDDEMAVDEFGRLSLGNDEGYTTTLNINAGGFVSSTDGAGNNLGLYTNGTLVVGPNGDAHVLAGWVSGIQGNNTVNGGSITVNGGSLYVKGANTLEVSNGGSITLESGALTLIPGTTSSELHQTRVFGGSTIVIKNGEASIEKLYLGAHNGSPAGSLILTNGRVNLVGTVRVAAANCDGIVEVSGGSVMSEGPLYVGNDNYHGSGGTFNLSGGTWEQTTGSLVSLGNKRGTDNFMSVTGTGLFVTSGDTDMGVNDSTAASGGILLIDGGSYIATNAAGSATLTIKRGTVDLQAGHLSVDRLVVTNGTLGILSLDGGTMTVSTHSEIDQDAAFSIGDGSRAALLNLAGTAHIFADDVQMNSNAVLGVRRTASFLSNLAFVQGSGLKIDGGELARTPIAVQGMLTLPPEMTIDLSLPQHSHPNELTLFTYGTLSASANLNGITFVNPDNYKAVDDPINQCVVATYIPFGSVVVVR